MDTTKNIKKLKSDFLEQNQENYKELCDYDVFALIKQLACHSDENPATQIAIRLHHRQMPKIIRLDQVRLPKAEADLRDFKAKYSQDFQDWQLTILQTPHQSYSGEEDPILVINEQNVIQPIGNYSIMINAISDKLEHIAFLCIDKTIANDRRVSAFIKNLQTHWVASA